MRYTLAATGALAAIILTQTTAYAIAAPPQDVARVFGSPMLSAMQQSDDGTVIAKKSSGEQMQPTTDFSTVQGFGTVREVFVWNPSFVLNAQLERPTNPINEWIAPALEQDGTPIGTATAWRPKGKKVAEVGGFNNDKELAVALVSLSPSAQLVQDPTIGAWYSLQDGSVKAITANGAAEIPEPVSLKEFQGVISRRYEQAIASSRGIEGVQAAAGQSRNRQQSKRFSCRWWAEAWHSRLPQSPSRSCQFSAADMPRNSVPWWGRVPATGDTRGTAWS